MRSVFPYHANQLACIRFSITDKARQDDEPGQGEEPVGRAKPDIVA